MATPSGASNLDNLAQSALTTKAPQSQASNLTGAAAINAKILAANPNIANAQMGPAHPGFWKNLYTGGSYALGQFGRGAAQAFQSGAGDIDAFLARHLPQNGFQKYEQDVAQKELQSAKSLGQKAANAQKQWESSGSKGTVGGTIGDLAGNIAPYVVGGEALAALRGPMAMGAAAPIAEGLLPQAEGLAARESPGLLKVLAKGAASDIPVGAAVGALQPVQPGQSRALNAAVSANAAPIIGTAARIGGHLIGDAAQIIFPSIRNMAAKTRIGQYIENELLPKVGISLRPAVAGMRPTLAAATLNPQVGSMERYLAQDPRYSAAFTARDMENKQAIHNALGKLGDVTSSPTELSQGLGTTVNNIVDAIHSKQNEFWENPDFLKLPYNAHSIRQGMQDWINGLAVDNRKMLPSNLLSRLDDITQEKGATPNLSELQAYRSNLLRGARAAESPTGGQTPQSYALNGAAAKILDVLSKGEALPSESMAAYKAALKATREGHETLENLGSTVKKAQTAESTVGPHIINPGHPVPERLDAFLQAGQKYLDNADEAPDAARNYFVNVLTHKVIPDLSSPEPGSSQVFNDFMLKNRPILNKLFPDQARKQMIDDVGDALSRAEYRSKMKPADRGPDTANKLLGRAWISENIGHGMHLGGVGGGWLQGLLSKPEVAREKVLADAFLNPKVAALLRSRVTSKAFKTGAVASRLGKGLSIASLQAPVNQWLSSVVQPPPNLPP
ncbi:MAG: hypothetical protein KGI27_13345 [Thaumarchaeota archaeon]|nr:hypothetical protein [Nitrososphaerota archaeon]